MYCQNCGEALPEDAKFCALCGISIDEGRVDNVREEPSGNTTRLTDLYESLYSSEPVDANEALHAGPHTQPISRAPTMNQGVKPGIVAAVIGAVVGLALVAALAFFIVPSLTQTKTHTVTFDTNGGSSVEAMVVKDGETISTNPADPTKEGYYFDHWENEAGEVTNFANPITEDVTYTAVWEEDGGDDANGGETHNQTASPQEYESPEDQQDNPYTLEAPLAKGGVITGTIRHDGNGSVLREYGLADYNNRVFSESEINNRGMSDAELCIAWNEIIAAETNYTFKNRAISKYFYTFWGYVGSNAKAGVSGNAAKNVEILQSCQKLQGKPWQYGLQTQ